MPEAAEAGHQVEHLLAAERVEPGGGLVEQHQLGVGDERLGQLGALAHAGGEAADGPEAGLVEPDEVEDVGRALAGRPGREPAELAEGRHDVGGGLVERAGSRARACSRGGCARRSGPWPRRCRTPRATLAWGG